MDKKSDKAPTLPQQRPALSARCRRVSRGQINVELNGLNTSSNSKSERPSVADAQN
ncbi:hypothetical protein KIN20_013174 [Parelaphostrongylus tenuis]|uniref:Uncharacterized protein n=1 Tax=Parelaphostrongylus tenuis TaxID=148309 RepID=A0AAD5MBS5_PARTN|nr:hypothetical protein KIN20_013174 [Parelaphostrongylus tenuis]